MPAERDVPGTPADWLARARSDLALAKIPLPEGRVYEAILAHLPEEVRP